MNPQGPPAGWQPNLPALSCPYGGCSHIENSIERLNYHMEHAHMYPSPQQLQQASRGQQLSRYHGGPHPLRNASYVSSTNKPISPTTQIFQQLASTYRNCSSALTSNNSQRSPPAHASMGPPPIQAQIPTLNPAAYRTTDEQALSEATKSWPATAHALLKDLIITYALYSTPKTAEEHDKLVELYERFHADTKTLGMNLATDDDILWKLFRAKVGLIQAEMLEQGEIMSTPHGLVWTAVPRKKVFLAKPRQEPLSTPPTTPVLPTESLKDGLESWNAMNGKAQARIIGKILRAAKNPQRIMLECEAFCAEVRSKEEKEARDTEGPFDPLQAKEINERLTQRPTPSKTPDPVAKKSLDLQAMIDQSLREVRMKRALEKRAREASEEEPAEGEEDVARKRVKVEPLG